MRARIPFASSSPTTALNVPRQGPLPDYKELIAKYGDRFQAQDMQSVQSLPSGIIGP